MYVLDTNTLIYYFKGQGKVAENIANVSPQEIGISTIVLFELKVGIAKSTSPAKRTQQLQQLLSRVNLFLLIGMRLWLRLQFLPSWSKKVRQSVRWMF